LYIIHIFFILLCEFKRLIKTKKIMIVNRKSVQNKDKNINIKYK
jgi:hypothetical protein